MTRVFCLLLTWSIIELLATGHSQAQPAEFDLENGLHVILQPLPTAQTTALIVLYNVGHLHDPPEKSGMAHLAEHLYVTAASDQTPARDVNQYVKAYPDGWNAQTGDDYTVIATVFQADRLDEELDDACQRMKKLTVTSADLSRELPRMQQELDNMYQRIPGLAVRNLGRERLRPLAHRGRRGGQFEQLKTIDVPSVQTWLNDYYKPNNAVLVLAGPFDQNQARTNIDRLFGSLAVGRQPVAEPPQKLTGERKIELPVSTYRPGEPARAGIAFAAPRPDGELYPAFLIQVARLQMAGRQLVKDMKDFPVAYMPVDQPGFVFVSLPVGDTETADDAIVRLRKFVAEQTGQALTKNDARRTKMAFGMLLGLSPIPERFQANNPYGTAFSLGRRHQMGIESAELAMAIDQATDEQLKFAQREYFHESKSVAAIVTTK